MAAGTGRGSEYVRLANTLYSYTDNHGFSRTVEIKPCSCSGTGCENCDAPENYLSDGYSPFSE